MMQQEGTILKGVGGLYTVRLTDGTLMECKARGIFRKENISPLAGDRVTVTVDTATIEEILHRKNSLVRPRMANIDQMVIVSSMAEPALNLFILDKMTAVAVSKKMEPIIVLTKADLASADRAKEIYDAIGMKCLCMTPESGEEVLEPLRGWLKGKLSAFTGNTGVGKPTLLGRLMNCTLETGDVSRKLGRGRHTTRQVELYELPDGGYAADTPGFSTLDIERYELVRREALPESFPEFAPYLDDCKFTSCTHRKEQGCAVCAAVAAGKIPQSRHESYCRMYDEVKDLKEWEHPTAAPKKRPR
jgi:ribosome biogenesis GTPase